jgi:glutamate transport system substrate-binding protein
MNLRKTTAAAFAVVALAASATACGKSGSPGADATPSAGGGTASAVPTLSGYPAKSGVKLTGSPTWDRVEKAGKITIGVKADQPGLGYIDTTTNKRSGFDIEIARMVAADLGFPENKIVWKTIASNGRETSIEKHQVDFYVGTYTINDKRKESVSFAGPYFVAGQDLLVKAGSSIKSKDDLKGKKVCSAQASTSYDRLASTGANRVAYADYSLCVQNLLNGQVDAVSTDDAILRGYAAKYPDQLKVIGKPFSEEPYGIGLLKGDTVFQDALTAALKNHEDNGDWQKAFDATLGTTGGTASIPPLDS